LYADFGIDLERFNGDNSWSLPIPARFILDPQGTVIRADSNPDYTIRPEPEDSVKILRARK
jgi:peroxiredoxin